MDGRYRQHLVFVVLAILSTVGDVSALTSCAITPDFDMLTIRNRIGRTVELLCQCMDDNGMITAARWFLSDMNMVPTDSSNRPYSNGTAPSRLIFTNRFINSDAGTYTCSPSSTFPTIPPGDSIILTTAADPKGTGTCTIISTNLPTLKTPGGAIAYGTENVILYCLCMEDNIVTGPTRWFFNGTQVGNDESGSSFARNDIIPSQLVIPSFITGHNGTYSCGPGTDFSLVSQQGDNITLTLLVPTPTIRETAPSNQTVGQPLALECELTTVRGITSRVDIVWSSDGTVLQRMNNTLPTMMSNSLVYTNSYTTLQLSTANDSNVIQCEVVINANPPVMTSDSITLNVTVPIPNVSISPSGPIRGAMVGSPQVINCTVSTVSGVESSSVMISWMGPGGAITTNGRISIGSVTDDGNNMFTGSLQFTYLMEGDEGTYTCNVMILDTSGSQSVELQSLAVPTPTVSVTALSNQTVGESLALQCNVTTVRGITSGVDIMWSDDNGMLQIMDGLSPITVNNSLAYTDSYTISQLSTTDDGRVIQCEVVTNTVPPVMASDNITLDVIVPTPNITISPSGPIQGTMVGSPQVINCTMSTVRGVESSSVMISWMGPGGAITTTNGRVSIGSVTGDGNNMYTSSLQFTYLMEGDEGTYACNVMILDTRESQPVVLQSLAVPTPTVSVTALSNQTVGESLALQCNVTTVRGITSGVDIMWSDDNGMLQIMDGLSPITVNNSLAYTDSYTISQLSTTDDGRVIQCEVVTNTVPPVMASDNITLDVIVPTPNITMSPSGPIQGAMVGSPQVINCTVSTVRGVESSSVMISWMGPGGAITTTNGRVSIGSVTGDGNNMYTSSLQFTYLMEGDEGTYTCNVIILDTSGSQSVELQSLAVPAPIVSVTALNTQTVGQSLTLQCNVITVRGITSTVDIVWSDDDGTLEMMDGLSPITINNSLVYTDSYNISQLSTTDDGRVIQCQVEINASPPVTASNNITLDVTVSTLTVTLSPPGSIQGAMVGSPQVINCTVSTVSGVGSSSVMISWMGPGGAITNNSRVIISQTTSRGNTHSNSLQFTYLMEGDEGTYTCNVKVLDTSESQSVEIQSLTIPTPTVSVTAPNIQTVGQPLTLECNGTTVRGITSGVDLQLRRDGREIDSTGAPTATTGNLVVYRVSYTITRLSTSDDGARYNCRLTISSSPMERVAQGVTLDVTVPTPTVIISPPGSIQGAMVGSPQVINCTASTVSGVGSSSVMISWMGPGGAITNDRVTISPTTSSGNTYFSSLRFIFLTKGDEGTYTCNVMILDTSGSQSVELESPTVPPPNVTISPSDAIQGAMVGSPRVINCTVSTVSGVESSSVMISWIGPGGDTIMNNTRITINPTTSSGNTYTSSLQFTYLMEGDEGTYTCNVMILDTSGSQSVNITALNIPTPTVSVSPSGPIQGAMVGSPQDINCIVSTVNGVKSSSVMISWMGPRGAITANDRIFIGSVTDDGNNMYSSRLQFTYLMEGDNGMYTCNVMISGTNGSNSTEIQSLAVPTPAVRVTAPNTQTVGQSLTLQCNVTTARGIISRVDIVWSSGGTELLRLNNVSSTMMSSSLVYTNSYTISQLNTSDDGRVIQCQTVINASPPVMANDSTMLDVIVPQSSVMISQSRDSPNVGDNLILTCTVTVASGVSSSLVMVNWNTQDTMLPSSSISNTSVSGLQYTRMITFSPLLSNNSGQYICSVSVNGFNEASNSDSVMVEVNGLPGVNVMPPSQSVEVTHNATFTTTVTGVGSDNFTYQWRYNETIISGETEDTLILTNLTPENAGEYNCTVLNQYGDSASSVASLAVTVTPPVITMDPMNPPIELFTNFTNETLTCEADGASSYNWERQNGDIPSDSTGINTTTLILINLQPEDAGNYRCVATNASGSTPSEYADVTINVPAPRIIIQPVDKTIPAQQNATFTCVGQGYGFVNVVWVRGIRNRSPPDKSIVFTIVTSDNITSILTIPDLRGRDEGRYWCRYNNSGGVTNSTLARLTIGTPPPEIRTHPMNTTVINGSNVTFNCVSFSFAPVSYAWLKDGVALLDDDLKYFITTVDDEDNDIYTTTLMISDVQLSDNGAYVCSVTISKDKGTASSSDAATLSVIVPPVFTLHPESNVTNEMGYVELSCTATSIVSVMFQWEKFINNTWEPFPNNSLVVEDKTINDTAYTSIIRSINIPQSDEGSYRCTASNSAGTSISDVATITVYGPPMIVSLSDTITIVEGEIERVSFVCEADNDPNATINVTIRWFGNSGHRIRNDDDDRITISTTMETGPNRTVMSTLIIDQVMHQDAGQYRCEALNYHGLTDSNVTRLIVEFAPIVTIVVMDQTNQSKVNVTLNTTFNMTCDVESYPPAMFHWEADGERVSNDTLLIVDTSMRGTIVTYTCVAVNEINGITHSANKSIKVIIQAMPDVIPTDDIKQPERTVTTVVVQWKEPNYYNAPITMYTLNLCRKLQEDDCESIDNDNSMNITDDDYINDNGIVRYNITELQPFSINPYQLIIRAVNDIGPAKFSDPVEIILVTQMEAAVQNLTLTTLNNSEVLTTWNVADLFELSFFNVSYFIKSELQGTKEVTVNTYQISDLIPGETYTVAVTAYYNKVFPSATIEKAVMLARIELTPPMVNDLVLPENNDDPVILSWTKPELTGNNTEFFQGYDVSFSRGVFGATFSGRRKRNIQVVQTETERIGPNETSYEYNISCPYNSSLTLCPYSQYFFFVISVFAFGNTPIDTSDPQSAIMPYNTSEAAPNGPPREFNQTNVGIHEIGIRWNFPEFPNGVITGFTVYVNNTEQQGVILICDGSTFSCSTTLVGLGAYILHNIEVSCSTRVGEGPRTNNITIRTSIGRPTVIDGLQQVDYSQSISSPAITNLEIDIPEFNETDGEINHYFIVIINVTVQEMLSAASVENDMLRPHNSSRPYYVAAVLQPNEYRPAMPFVLGNSRNTSFKGIRYQNVPLTLGTYRYFVRAVTIGPGLSGDSDVTDRFTITRAGDDGSDATGPIIGAIAAVAVILLIVLIVLIILAVITRRRGQRTSAAKLENSESIEMRKQASPTSPAARNTAPIINTTTVEVITSVNQPTTLFIETTGNPPAEIEWSKDGSPVNHPIMSDGSLYIMHTEPSDQGEYTVTATNPVGVSQQSITVTVIQPVALHSDPDHKPVKKDDFAQHMALLRSDMEEGFKMEYESLDMAEWEFTQYNAKVTVNKNKNRYINIIPYDHSRVVLNIQDNTAGSDYINASIVNGQNERYIATQGPIPSSYGDFWRMIWENESATIIMLTNLKEDDRVKCHQYWPSYGSAMYGNFQVTLRDVENLAEYSVRIFSVQPIAASADIKDDMREVRQFHFTVWPDHGVPKYGTALLSFQKRIDKFHNRKKHGPMVVHCSAGVGRTGTFITIDTQLQKIKHDGILDIFNFVRHLRYCRNYMVQTQAQYVFLHDTILEALMCGDTSIAAPVKDAKEKVSELAKVNPRTGKTGFETQFENLTLSSPPEDSFECNVARLPDNMRKNRFPDHLPSDVDRVVLSTDNDQPDYINACFLDGYRHRNAFIGTQGPMVETISDFWRMIWEHKSYAIIMLTELEENGMEMCTQYWPDTGTTLTYGTCIVENISEDNPRQDYIKRNFRIALTSNPADTRNITQFQFQQWPVNSCPNNPATIIDLLEAMERVQRKTGNGPITVHCNDGIGRTGTFCALAASLERFKTEQMVDVFHTIKTIRIQRAGMVQTLDQYEFIHKTLLEYMTRFELYDNFS